MGIPPKNIAAARLTAARTPEQKRAFLGDLRLVAAAISQHHGDPKILSAKLINEILDVVADPSQPLELRRDFLSAVGSVINANADLGGTRVQRRLESIAAGDDELRAAAEGMAAAARISHSYGKGGVVRRFELET